MDPPLGRSPRQGTKRARESRGDADEDDALRGMKRARATDEVTEETEIAHGMGSIETFVQRSPAMRDMPMPDAAPMAWFDCTPHLEYSALRQAIEDGETVRDEAVLLSLPHEVLLLIFRDLSMADLGALHGTCTTLHQLLGANVARQLPACKQHRTKVLKPYPRERARLLRQVLVTHMLNLREDEHVMPELPRLPLLYAMLRGRAATLAPRGVTPDAFASEWTFNALMSVLMWPRETQEETVSEIIRDARICFGDDNTMLRRTCYWVINRLFPVGAKFVFEVAIDGLQSAAMLRDASAALTLREGRGWSYEQTRSLLDKLVPHLIEDAGGWATTSTGLAQGVELLQALAHCYAPYTYLGDTTVEVMIHLLLCVNVTDTDESNNNLMHTMFASIQRMLLPAMPLLPQDRMGPIDEVDDAVAGILYLMAVDIQNSAPNVTQDLKTAVNILQRSEMTAIASLAVVAAMRFHAFLLEYLLDSVDEAANASTLFLAYAAYARAQVTEHNLGMAMDTIKVLKEKSRTYLTLDDQDLLRYNLLSIMGRYGPQASANIGFVWDMLERRLLSGTAAHNVAEILQGALTYALEHNIPAVIMPPVENGYSILEQLHGVVVSAAAAIAQPMNGVTNYGNGEYQDAQEVPMDDVDLPPVRVVAPTLPPHLADGLSDDPPYEDSRVPSGSRGTFVHTTSGGFRPVANMRQPYPTHSGAATTRRQQGGGTRTQWEASQGYDAGDEELGEADDVTEEGDVYDDFEDPEVDTDQLLQRTFTRNSSSQTTRQSNYNYANGASSSSVMVNNRSGGSGLVQLGNHGTANLGGGNVVTNNSGHQLSISYGVVDHRLEIDIQCNNFRAFFRGEGCIELDAEAIIIQGDGMLTLSGVTISVNGYGRYEATYGHRLPSLVPRSVSLQHTRPPAFPTQPPPPYHSGFVQQEVTPMEGVTDAGQLPGGFINTQEDDDMARAIELSNQEEAARQERIEEEAQLALALAASMEQG